MEAEKSTQLDLSQCAKSIAFIKSIVNRGLQHGNFFTTIDEVIVVNQACKNMELMLHAIEDMKNENKQLKTSANKST
jgi:hypothetical protein